MSDPDSDVFDVAVVGGGLIGSSAARHLSESGLSVVVVGAPEPTDWPAGIGPFSSHYDAGRITRLTATDPVWSELASRSIARYDDVATRSGIAFHDPRGLAWIGPNIDMAIDEAEQRGGSARHVSERWLADTTGIVAPPIDGFSCGFEDAPAGLIAPRALVAAELRLAASAGATVIAQPATGIAPASDRCTIAGPFGSVDTRRVLLATGAYGAQLVGVELELERRLRTIVRADVGPGAEIPSLIVQDVVHDALDGIYWVPPVEFPNGATQLKIGGDFVPVLAATDNADIDAWFAGGGSRDEAAALVATIEDLLPNSPIVSWEMQPCVVTYTPSGYPHIGWVDDRVAVAVGGCGSAAKSCDELGRIAASLFSSPETSEGDAGLITPELFTPTLKTG